MILGVAVVYNQRHFKSWFTSTDQFKSRDFFENFLPYESETLHPMMFILVIKR